MILASGTTAIGTHPTRRAAIRVLGDNGVEGPTGGAKGGRGVERFWWALRIGSVVGLLCPATYGVAVIARGIASALDTFDGVWNLLSSLPGQTSDGIVQGPSQVYPNATRNYAVPNPASHLGEVRSKETRRRLNLIFDDEIFLSKRSTS